MHCTILFSHMADYSDIHECVHFECVLPEHALCVWLTLGWWDQEGCGQIGLLKWTSYFLWVFSELLECCVHFLCELFSLRDSSCTEITIKQKRQKVPKGPGSWSFRACPTQGTGIRSSLCGWHHISALLSLGKDSFLWPCHDHLLRRWS